MVKSKPTRKFHFSDECPHFFKIYFPDQCSQRLRIPPAFVKEFSGVLPNSSVITSPSMESWRVDVNRVDHNLYFQKGWLEFVQGNELEFGDFLVFCYDGDSEFYVKIYGIDGCKKVPTEKTQKTLAVQENQTFKHKERKQPRCENSGNGVNKMTLRPRVLMANQEPDKDRNDAGNSVSAHPFFKVTMTPCYVANGPLNVPFNFFRSCVDLGRKSVLLRVSDKLWPVKLVTYKTGIAKISRGWYYFVREYALQVGDVCVFELTEREEYLEFYVKIYRKDGCLKVPTEKTEKTHAVQESQTFKHRKFKQPRFEDSGNGVNKMTSRLRVRKAVEEPSKDISNFVSAHPFFKVVMMPSFVASGILNIPRSFYKSYVYKGIKSVFLRVSDKLWPVKLILSGCHRTPRFSHGWGSFARENALQVGDVCVFELIERNEFEVFIFRCLEE